MIVIDGSMGEGGGQILRTSLSLATIYGETIKVYNIRAKRANPGLRPQHLTAIKAISEICNGKVENAKIGSQEILFTPGYVKGGFFEIDIGTAGSITLVLQTLIPPLLLADKESVIKIRGGTDVKLAPQISYFIEVFLELLKKMGVSISAQIIKRGYYPEGGGLVIVEIEPKRPSALSILERSGKSTLGGLAHSQNLPEHIVNRMVQAASKCLSIEPSSIKKDIRNGESTGTGIVLWCKFENTTLGSDELGEKGVPAEKVAEKCCRSLLREIDSEATVDINMSDQLMIYGVFSEVRYLSRDLTEHARTNAEVLRIFGIKADIEKFKNSYMFTIRR